MLDLATAFFERSDARALSRPVLKELARRTPFHVRLEVLSGVARVIAIEEHSRPAPRPPGGVGHVAPLHAGSGGLAILAFARGPVFNRVIAGSMEAFTPRTITSALRLRRELVAVRGGHVSYTQDQAGPGVYGLSAPILDAAGHAEAALTLVAVAGAPFSGDLPEHTAALLESAERLSRILRSSGRSPQELLVPAARLRVPA
jgi:DNA-binding IclR family transcriptional regulator